MNQRDTSVGLTTKPAVEGSAVGQADAEKAVEQRPPEQGDIKLVSDKVERTQISQQVVSSFQTPSN